MNLNFLYNLLIMGVILLSNMLWASPEIGNPSNSSSSSSLSSSSVSSSASNVSNASSSTASLVPTTTTIDESNNLVAEKLMKILKNKAWYKNSEIPIKTEIIKSKNSFYFVKIFNHPVHGIAIMDADGTEWSYDAEKDKDGKYVHVNFEKADKLCLSKGLVKGMNCRAPTNTQNLKFVSYLTPPNAKKYGDGGVDIEWDIFHPFWKKLPFNYENYHFWSRTDLSTPVPESSPDAEVEDISLALPGRFPQILGISYGTRMCDGATVWFATIGWSHMNNEVSIRCVCN